MTDLVIDFDEVLTTGAVMLNFGGEPDPVILHIALSDIASRLITNASNGNAISQDALRQIVINKFKAGLFLAELEAAALPC